MSDTDRPTFSGTNVNSPPGENHPVFNTPLSFGANKKWDNSRQIRGKRVNPFNISQTDISQPPLPNLFNFPTELAVGNDDTGTIDETNDPYSTQNQSKLTGIDAPFSGIAHRAGVNGNTYEERLQFREFTRLEIEGDWYRISDFYLWKLHAKFIKENGKWANNESVLALNNDGWE